jgi:hypothetical protein
MGFQHRMGPSILEPAFRKIGKLKRPEPLALSTLAKPSRLT